MEKFLLISEKILYVLLIALVVFIPLYPKLPFINVPGTYVAIRLEDFLISLTVGVWLIHLLLKGEFRRFFKTQINQLIILFLLIGLLSLLSGVYLTHSVMPHLGLLHLLRRVEILALLPITMSVIKTKKQLKELLLIFAGVVIVVCFYALGQKYLHFPVISTTNSEFSKGQILYLSPGTRANSTFAGHYDLAVYLTMALTVIAGLIIFFRSRWQLLIISALGALSFVVLILTGARVSFIAAIVGILITLGLVGRQRYILAMIIIATITLLFPSPLRDRFISTVTVVLSDQSQQYLSRNIYQEERSKLNIPTLTIPESTAAATDFLSASEASGIASDIVPGEPTDYTQLEVNRSYNIRLKVEWPRALRAFIKNPLLGTGYSSLGLATDNDILRSLGEVGLLGTTAFALILLAVVKQLFVTMVSGDKLIRGLAAGMIGVVVGFMINGLFIDAFEASKVASLFWIWMGIGMKLSEVK